MSQTKLYPAGQLSDHPKLRTLDEVMRGRIRELLADLYVFVHGERIKRARANMKGECTSCVDLMRRIDSVLALLKD